MGESTAVAAGDLRDDVRAAQPAVAAAVTLGYARIAPLDDKVVRRTGSSFSKKHFNGR